MKKLAMTLTLLTGTLLNANAHYSFETHELLSATTFGPFMTTSEELRKQEAQTITSEVAVYDFTGEIRPELAARIDKLQATEQGEVLSDDEAINLLSDAAEAYLAQ